MRLVLGFIPSFFCYSSSFTWRGFKKLTANGWIPCCCQQPAVMRSFSMRSHYHRNLLSPAHFCWKAVLLVHSVPTSAPGGCCWLSESADPDVRNRLACLSSKVLNKTPAVEGAHNSLMLPHKWMKSFFTFQHRKMQQSPLCCGSGGRDESSYECAATVQ